MLLESTSRGLWCEPGGFFVDPWRPVDRAVITHAHADHAVPGSGSYLAAKPGGAVARTRLGASASIELIDYGERVEIGDVTVSLHPAGHVLGSAQVRIEHRGEVWVVSGDYKVEADPTCDVFEPVRCDVFITESTFGLPIYAWPRPEDVFSQINGWWADNASNGRASVLYAYALGKAQRLLSGVDPSIGPIIVHGSIGRLNEAYAASDVALPECSHFASIDVSKAKGSALIVAPPSVANTPWLRRFKPLSDAFASGWMRIRGTRRRRSIDRGFVISDHADWCGLLRAIDETGASRIGVTHGYAGQLARWLNERDKDAWVVPTRYVGETDDTGEAGDDASSVDPVEGGDDA